jgi:threonine/homoserine/homoserine lactone efflux protein
MSAFFAMGLFALSMSISPGPVNLLTLSTGVNHGFRRALPFVSGATVGFTLILLLVGLGVGELAVQNEVLMNTLGLCGCVFLIYLGFKIMRANPDLTINRAPIPTFMEGAILQWLNPKAWIASLAGTTAFNTAGSMSTLMIFVLLYFLICYASIASWALTGDKIRAVLSSATALKALNIIMGGALILVAGYLALQQGMLAG